VGQRALPAGGAGRRHGLLLTSRCRARGLLSGLWDKELREAPWCVISRVVEERLPAWCLWDAETRSIKPLRHLAPPELDAEMPSGGLGLRHQ